MLTTRSLAMAVRLAWLTAEAWTGLALFDAARVLGFRATHAWIAARRVARRTSSSPEAIVWAVDEACVWYVKRALCLQRSAVATWMLRRHGYAAAVVIGYRPVPFESHAWVELDGRVVNDRPQYQKYFRVLERA